MDPIVKGEPLFTALTDIRLAILSSELIRGGYYTAERTQTMERKYTVTVTGGSGKGHLTFRGQLIATEFNPPKGPSENFVAGSSITFPFQAQSDSLATTVNFSGSVPFEYGVAQELHFQGESHIRYGYEGTSHQAFAGETANASIRLEAVEAVGVNNASNNAAIIEFVQNLVVEQYQRSDDVKRPQQQETLVSFPRS
jgi:hypothetical protein